jgi:alpha-ketoglutarate-dependent taurine dioxygenase
MRDGPTNGHCYYTCDGSWILSLPYLCETTGSIVCGTGDLTDLDVDTIQSLFQQSSVVLFRGFNAGRDQFRRFSSKVSSEFVTHLNFSRQQYGDRTMTSVSPGNGHFFAHAEMGYVPFRPDVAWFYCERPAREGGETTVYDGVEVLNQLKTETRRLFEDKRILFRSSIPQHVWVEMAPDKDSLNRYMSKFDGKDFSFEFDETDCLHTRFAVSAISHTRYGGHLAFCNSLLDTETPRFEDETQIPKGALHDVIATTEQRSIPVLWQTGDILMLDNSRFMHGRREFEDQGRQILVRFSNVAF